MQAQFPFPIAYPYHLIGTARSPADRYDRLLQCYEAVVRYCVNVQMSDYLTAGCPDEDLNRKLLQSLPRKTTLGQWIEITRKITALQKRGTLPAYMPELAEFYFKPGKRTSLTPEGEIFDSLLCADRNDWGHRQVTWSADTYAQKFEQQKKLLDRLLGALSFLTRYTLYVAYDWRGNALREALVLMGPTEPPQLATDLNLPLAPRVREHLERELTSFLVAQDDPARQLLLHPLSVFANRDGSEDIFLFDRCDLSHETVRRLLYRGVRIGQKPLEISPGSENERLVEHFRTWLATLRGEDRATEETSAPPSAVSDYYFAAQREIVEEFTRSYVGRTYVTQALDRFLSANRRGYFIVRGGPGQGKSAVAAHLVKSRGLVHHFISKTGGRADPRLTLGSLLAQLLPLARIDTKLPDSVPELTKNLEDILARVATEQEGLTLVVDALDELPAQAGTDLPFVVTDALPEGVHVIVTSRPGDRLEQLQASLFSVPCEVYELGPLELDEMATILRASQPDLSDPEVERIAEVSQGNPLYLRAVTDELQRTDTFDLRDLPKGIEGFFRNATRHLRDRSDDLLGDVLGLLSAARKPLSLRELGQITGSRQRQTYEQGIRPIRPFLLDVNDGYSLYHASFHDFVTRELIYEDEVVEYHRTLAAWLQRPECRSHDYRWLSLAYHLYHSGDGEGLLRVIDSTFLADKVRRHGYAVLEDIELLTRAMLEAGDPNLVERCVRMVEGLREVVGGDVIEETRQSVRGFRAGPVAYRSRVVAPQVATVPGLDVWVGMLPKIEVGADFFEVIPLDNRLVLAIGDAPGTGLKSAFIARFIGNVFRRLVEQADPLHLGEVLGELNRIISAHEFFETMSMQCVLLDPRKGIMALASAGHPYPVLYSARRGQCDRLPVRGDLLHASFYEDDLPVCYEQRRAEIGPGDLLVLISDGLTEGHCLVGDPYGYRFTQLVEEVTTRDAKTIGEAILDDWRHHPRVSDDADDVTVMVVAVRSGDTAHGCRSE